MHVIRRSTKCHIAREVGAELFSFLQMHVKAELVPVGKQDIVACIPDFIPSFHCSANLIPVTMAVEHRGLKTRGHLYDVAPGPNITSSAIADLLVSI